MENLEPKEKEVCLAEFQEEMTRFQEDERSGVRHSGHFLHTPGFNPKELTGEDMVIWRKIKDQSITAQDVKNYRDRVVFSSKDYDTSRGQFYQMIANAASTVLVRKQMDAEKSKNKTG